MPRPKRPFDVVQRHKTVHQLRDLFNLDKVRFQEMKKVFRRVTKTRLDVAKNGRCQGKAVDVAVEDVKSQFPDLFKKGNIEQRVFLARRLVLITHSNRRATWLRSMKDNQNTSEEDESHPPSSDKPRPSLAGRMAANILLTKNGAPAPKIFASPVRDVEPSSGSVIMKLPQSETPASTSRLLVDQQHSPALPSQTPKPEDKARISSSSISEPGSSNTQVSSHIYGSREIKITKTSFSTPKTSSSNAIASSSTSISCGDARSSSIVTPSQIHSVHKFLAAALPPMTHLLDGFIDFGCRNEEFLFAISMWPPEEIRRFLKSLPPGPRGNALTKMEVEILVYHFESYFQSSNL